MSTSYVTAMLVEDRLRTLRAEAERERVADVVRRSSRPPVGLVRALAGGRARGAEAAGSPAGNRRRRRTVVPVA